MIGKSIDQITEQDLLDLIENSVIESKTIEYKQSLPGNSDSEKKEFLADISSFANASGGDLVYGIIEDETTREPKTLEGVLAEKLDQEIARLDSMTRDGIEPRILGISFGSIKLTSLKTALVIRVPKSWISPHRVSFKGHDKFYSRSANGKYPLDVAELRIAFSLSETIVERIRKFREDRISQIYANETPIPFTETARIVLHMIPIGSFDPAQNYEISKIASDSNKLKLIYDSARNHRYNLDGFLTYSGGADGVSHSYVQLFKNGIIEAVEGSLLEPSYNGNLVIPSVAYEEELISSVKEYLAVLELLGIDLPLFLFLSLLGVKGYSMAVNPRRVRVYKVYKIDRDILLLPEIVIENYDVVAKDVLRPCFDSIWNACGFPRSLNYDDDGKWVADK